VSADDFAWLGDAASRLNGKSTFRTADFWKPTEPGDAILGTVERVERPVSRYQTIWSDGKPPAVVTLRVVQARAGGVDIEPGSWVKTRWSVADLRAAWEQVGGIDVGDDVLLGYQGRILVGGTAKHSFSVSIRRAEESASPVPSSSGAERW
jgi:hypothetical protein